MRKVGCPMGLVISLHTFVISLHIEKLTEWLELEQLDENKSKATPVLHNHYREVSRILLKQNSDNMKDADQINQLIEVQSLPFF